VSLPTQDLASIKRCHEGGGGGGRLLAVEENTSDRNSTIALGKKKRPQ